jgi:hypothetical protein
MVAGANISACFCVCQETKLKRECLQKKQKKIPTKNGESQADKKVVRRSNVLVLTSHAGLNPRSKSGNEREARAIKNHFTAGKIQHTGCII